MTAKLKMMLVYSHSSFCGSLSGRLAAGGKRTQKILKLVFINTVLLLSVMLDDGRDRCLGC